MIYIPRWQSILIILSCILAVLYAAPNLVSQQTRDTWAAQYAAWLPVKGVALGLDLRGGSHLLLQVDLDTVARDKMDDLAASIRAQLRDDKIDGATVAVKDRTVTATVATSDQAAAARASMRLVEPGLIIDTDTVGTTMTVSYDEAAWRTAKNDILSQSIEIVRRRVDESGTRESTIVRQGDDRILLQIPGLDDPAQIKQLLGRTAKLTFHLVDNQMEPGAGSKTYPMQDNPTERLSVARRPVLTGEMLTKTQPSQDELGRPAVGFNLNALGSQRFCDLTRNNPGRLFAIILDNEIISAPQINDAICGGSAIITSARFGTHPQEMLDLITLLRAGALPAPLKVIEERTIGPSLGSDSVAAGKTAALVGLALVAVNMIASYGLFGVFAAVALLLNVTMILAILSFIGATLTLPGIAGIVLTIGMAVDANVLIFERIREEIRAGKSVVASLDAGYSRAMGTIIDSNLTTLIAALVLFLLGAGPIKGFAITLSIGILTSIFSAVMVTRLMVVFWYHRTRPKTLQV
jgi:preprotein translocase subunit SecD